MTHPIWTIGFGDEALSPKGKTKMALEDASRERKRRKESVHFFIVAVAHRDQASRV